MRDQGMRLLKSHTWVIQNRSSSIGGGDKTQDEGILGAILRLFLVTIIIHDGVQYGRLDYRSTMLLLHPGRSHPTSDLAVTDIAAAISGWFEADEQHPEMALSYIASVLVTFVLSGSSEDEIVKVDKVGVQIWRGNGMTFVTTQSNGPLSALGLCCAREPKFLRQCPNHTSTIAIPPPTSQGE